MQRERNASLEVKKEEDGRGEDVELSSEERGGLRKEATSGGWPRFLFGRDVPTAFGISYCVGLIWQVRKRYACGCCDILLDECWFDRDQGGTTRLWYVGRLERKRKEEGVDGGLPFGGGVDLHFVIGDWASFALTFAVA